MRSYETRISRHPVRKSGYTYNINMDMIKNIKILTVLLLQALRGAFCCESLQRSFPLSCAGSSATTTTRHKYYIIILIHQYQNTTKPLLCIRFFVQLREFVRIWRFKTSPVPHYPPHGCKLALHGLAAYLLNGLQQCNSLHVQSRRTTQMKAVNTHI